MPRPKFYSQTILGTTTLFGKEYVWLQDVDGTVYLAHIDEFGQPDLGH